MNSFHSIDYTIVDRIAYVTLDRPENLNRLDETCLLEIKEAFTQAEKAEEVRVIVLAGTGEAFCAGMDAAYLKRMSGMSLDENLADSSALAHILMKMYRSSKVYIAQVAGAALSAGCTLAAVCDFAFASPEAHFGYPEVKQGFVPALATPFLLRKLGETRTKELLLSGEAITADQAERYHLIHRVVESDALAERVRTFAQTIGEENAPAAMQFIKKLIADVQEFPIEHAIKFAAKLDAHSRGTEDSRRGIEALLNKEQLRW